MVSVLEEQLNLWLNSLFLDYTPWRKNCLILNGSYYHWPEKAPDDKSKLVVVTTVVICTRFCVEFQNVCSVLQPIDQRIIACQGLCTLTDSSCILAYFCLFESFSCFSHYSLFAWVLQTNWSFQIWRNICFYRWWLLVRYHSPCELVTSVVPCNILTDNQCLDLSLKWLWFIS